MSERVIDFVARMAAAVVAAMALYVLTAPPIMTSLVNQSGTASFPAVYQPILRLIESDFSGPVLWYFNDVWGCEIVQIGEAVTPWYVVMSYAVFGLGFLGAVLFPFWRRLRKGRAT